MASNRLISDVARALRDLLSRAHLRADLLPRLPFGIAIVVALVALVVAIEHDPETDEATVAVDELPSGPPTFYEGEDIEETTGLEILEYGFGKITEASGRERMIVAAIVRNPHDAEAYSAGLAIHAETDEGFPVRLEEFYLHSLPPGSTAGVGHVVNANVDRIEVEDLRLTAAEPLLIYPDVRWETDEEYVLPPLPEVEFIGTEALTSPDGYRVHFRTEAAEAVAGTQFSVLFRDGEGRLIGGLPVSGDPMLNESHIGRYRVVPEGESFQYFDLHESWIPAGADLDLIEVGPGR
jgi:hypothetical protein